MNFIDVIVIILIALCALCGMKRGFTKELFSFLGFFLVVVLSFILKNPLSTLMYENLPFFNLGGLFKGITALNIVLYEVIAFFVVMAILLLILKVILFASKIFEKLLSLTIILGIPSKILGFIIGIIEGFTWSFILLYIVSLPLFNFREINDSKLKENILDKTPILNSFTKNFRNTMDDFVELRDEYEVKGNKEKFNYDTMNLLLKYKIISVKSANKLNEKGKLKIDNIDILLNQYKD